MKTTRLAVKEDEDFIYATWLRSQYYGNTWFKSINRDVYFENYKAVVRERIASNVVLISCLSSDPDVVLGYSVVSRDGTTLHWLYVKRAWRRKGIARDLFPQTVSTVTSMTKVARALMPSGLVFNPWKT